MCHSSAPAPAAGVPSRVQVPPSTKTSYGTRAAPVRGARDRGTVSSSPCSIGCLANKLTSWRPQCLHLCESHSQLACLSCVVRGCGHHVADATVQRAGILSAYSVAMILPPLTNVLGAAVAPTCVVSVAVVRRLFCVGWRLHAILHRLCSPRLHLAHSGWADHVSTSTCGLSLSLSPSIPVWLSSIVTIARTALLIRLALSSAVMDVRSRNAVYREAICEATTVSRSLSLQRPDSASRQLVPFPHFDHAMTAAVHHCQMCSAPASPSPHNRQVP